MSLDKAYAELAERNVQAQPGDGTSSEIAEMIDESQPDAENGSSMMHTKFNHWEAPSSQEGKWRNLWQLADGQRNSDKSSQNWAAGKQNDAKLFADQLNFAEHERTKLKKMAREVDFTKFGSFSTDQVLVASASLIRDENTTKYENRIILQDEFKELMEVTGVGSKQLRKMRQAIRERTNFF
jgi:hypothetical protein